MHKKLLTLLILSIFLINTLHATKNNESNHRKRQHEENEQNEENRQNKTITKKRKLTKLETEQKNNYPETLTWEDLIKNLPNRDSKYLDFVKNEIITDAEKNDFLNIFKKLYCKNIPLSQNNNILVSLAQYFQNLYRPNIDNDMNLIDIIFKSFSPTENGTKHTITSMAEILRTKNLQKDTITLIKKIVDQLIQEGKNADFISTIVSYALKIKKKEYREEKIINYINDYSKVYSKQEKNITINNNSIQSDINFTKLYNKLNETNKKFFQNSSPALQNSLKRALHIRSDVNENIFLEEFSTFYTKFPYLFNNNDEYSIAHFEKSSFYKMTNEELHLIATQYIPLFKTKFSDSWQTALTLCRQLSFIKIKFLAELLSTIENITKKTQDKFFAFMKQCIDMDTLENKINIFNNFLETNNNNIIELDQIEQHSLIKNIKNNFPNLNDENICTIPLKILYNLNPITLNSSPVTYREFLKKESSLLNNLIHLFNRPSNLECINKALENISSFLLTLIDHPKNRNESNNVIETLEKLRHLHRKIQAINSINVLQDTHLQNLLRNHFQNHSDTFIENVPKLIFYHITNAHIDIRDVLSDILHRQLTYIANPERYNRLTQEEHNKINDIIHYFSPCLDTEPDLLLPSQRIKAGNNDIYYTLIDIRRTLNQIIARLNGTEVNYNDRQSLHNKETHKVVDDMIQELYKKFPLNEYALKKENAVKFYDSENIINQKKTNDINNSKIDFIFKLFASETDIKKFDYFLFETLEIPTFTNEEFDVIFNECSSNTSMLTHKLNDHPKEIKFHDAFASFLERYFNAFKNNPALTPEQKDISFREIFNNACVHLEQTKKLSEDKPILSKEKIQDYINCFLSTQAKNLIFKIMSSINTQEELNNQFLQPTKGNYRNGLFALLLRTILNIIETTPNKIDLKDKFLTLRNNLAHANFEYVDIFANKEDEHGNFISFNHAFTIGAACDYGKSYAMLEQFLNVLNIDETININASNFTPIIMNFVQEEVERINKSTKTTKEKISELTECIINTLKDTTKYAQDFWEKLNNPLVQIDAIVEGLSSYFEDDDDIMIEEEKQT